MLLMNLSLGFQSGKAEEFTIRSLKGGTFLQLKVQRGVSAE